MSVVAKMQCTYVDRLPVKPGEYEVAKVRLSAMYGQTPEERALPENKFFGNATPWGTIEMGVGNPAAHRYFIPGLDYKIYFECVTKITDQFLEKLQGEKTRLHEYLSAAESRLNALSADDADRAAAYTRYGETLKSYELACYHLERAVAMRMEQTEEV